MLFHPPWNGLPGLNVHQGGEVVQTIVGAKPKAALEREPATFLSDR